MDERLKMAAFAFVAAACTGGIWLMQASGPKAASAAVDPLPEDQRIAQIVREEVNRELPGAVEAEVRHQMELAGRKAQENQDQQAELLRREAEKWAPAYQAGPDLQRLRSGLELYKIQHHDHYPTLAALQDWKILLCVTDDTGKITGTVAPGIYSRDGGFGPYLQSSPLNLFNQKTSVVAAGHATADAGWTYDEGTGALHIVVPAAELERAKPLNGDFEIGK